MDVVNLRGKRKRRVISILIIIALISGVTFTVFRLTGTEGSLYADFDGLTTGRVEYRPFTEYVRISATVYPARTIWLVVPYSGVIESIDCREGESVVEGDPVFTMTSHEMEKAIMAKEYQIAAQELEIRSFVLREEIRAGNFGTALLDYDVAVRDLEVRLESNRALSKIGVVPEKSVLDIARELQLALDKREIAECRNVKECELADIEQHKQELQLQLLQSELEELANLYTRRIITAPFDGLVTAVLMESDMYAAEGSAVIRIDSRDEFKLAAEIDEYYLDKVKSGLAGSVRIDDEYSVMISRVAPIVENNRFTVELKFVDSPPHTIKSGRSFLVRINFSGEDEVLTIPNGSFFSDTGGHWVFVLDSDNGRAVRRLIKIGRSNADYLEVLEGLNDGDRIVISSYAEYNDIEELTLLSK